MDSKTLQVLEYPKILERLAANCDFSASAALARSLEPTISYDTALLRLQETSEARRLISVQDISIGGAHDVRAKVELARRGGVLDTVDLLDIKYTLISCRELKRSLLGKNAEPNSPFHSPLPASEPKAIQNQRRKLAKEARDGSVPRPDHPYPHLAELALALPVPAGIVDAITRTISDKGEVLDSASPRLGAIRAEIRVARERLMSRLQRYLGDGKTSQMLQDTIITQRDGRYVIPLRAEFKGQIKSIVHDQSSSGATLFIEPIAVVELNNKMREVELAERDEIRRVLAEVSALVGLQGSDIIAGVEALASIDLAFAKAKYAEEIRASEPILHRAPAPASRPQSSDPNLAASVPSTPSPVIRLLRARHPLIDPAFVVANDIDLASGTRAVVITGPNTGGKTVSLKTVGLLVVMAQSGLHIPAQSGSELSMFHDVFADIGDEQSIEQSLSTFSGHITNIIRILKKIDSRALVILDELGAGTDPQEGAALARAILSHLLERGASTFVATHYPELKAFAHSAEGVVNASLEFDVATLRPTYRLTIGLPGRSNALAIAARLGLSESIIADARNEVNPDELRADRLLDDIRKERNRSSREREKAEKARQRTDDINNELAQRLEKIEDERREVIAKAKAEAELEVEVLKRSIGRLKADLKKMRQPLDALEKLETKVELIEEKTQVPVERQVPKVEARPSPTSGVLKLGEKVIVRTLGSEGIVTALSEGEAEVQVGSLRIRAKLGDIQRKSDALENQAAEEIGKIVSGRTRRIRQMAENMSLATTSYAAAALSMATPSMELDLRGQRAEDALLMLDNYLDKAYLAGMPFVRIIHGKGTGKLRQEVRAALKEHTQVASFEEGHPNEGGDGVTVAKIVKD
ncbi:MAG: endonuclease MutS2 [Chloroflexi bacterium]|nr:endonuclease MutS2 [Chloroflexota bacterium]